MQTDKDEKIDKNCYIFDTKVSEMTSKNKYKAEIDLEQP